LTLKAPGTKRLQLKYDKLLTIFAFNFNLRRYMKGVLDEFGGVSAQVLDLSDANIWGGGGRAVQVHPMKPTLKAPETKRLKVKHDQLLSILLQCCFQNDLRRYDEVATL